MRTIILLFCIINIVTFLILRKSKYMINIKKYRLILLILFITCIIFLSYTIIKDQFTVFSTPEEAYYDYCSDAKIEIIVEGTFSDMVVGVDGVTKKPLIVPKDEKGWRVSNGFQSKTVHNNYYDGIMITVDQYRGTQDFYIRILDISGNEMDISHNRDSKFIPLSNETSAGESLLEYYAYVQNFNEDYSLIINGKSIEF